MLTTPAVVSIFSVAMLIVSASEVCGQTYPTKPIRIVTSSVGGGSDFAARMIAQGIAGPLGQQVIVENRPSGVIPGQVVSQAPPDGYTLLLGSTSLWIGPLLRKTPYDPVRDFTPISTVSTAPMILVVHPSVPVKSVKELMALAKTKPGELNYAAGAVGATAHLAAELFKSMAGVNIVRISYASTAQGTSELIGGYVHLKFDGWDGVEQHIKSGRLRGLAVTSAQPSALVPDLPTIAATVPGYEMVAMDGMFAPAKTPEAIIKRLNQEIVRFLKMTEAKERFLTAAGGEAIGSSPEEFAAKIKSTMTRLEKVIKDAGIRVE